MKEIDPAEFLGEFVSDHGEKLKVVVQPMTREQARAVFPYRPSSKYAESTFGGNTFRDDKALLLSRAAKRCKMCTAATTLANLKEDICPDCDGRSELNGLDPHLSPEDYYARFNSIRFRLG
ncbi:MAG: hypothetical protein COV31_00460 [Candidatus Yanofskybacteria bacterium CG10_big_fil_rev_8_21_14_0_10_46_23]|uniref:Uncharacterized protein n=1 Tax=Candidatus Yanofskybacteria bacterium CG10_big_fil_rev_8_21_14_0_10_46_23 TaxID=1975098 RepID=A0A2H0R4W4_9BACT|nr:MAG: hypothetical protein COV31_00460 [Candidatus Yanofskybacteria bacterium CG10_big_fil_rev_8_21_14_0_10_46_23]